LSRESPSDALKWVLFVDPLCTNVIALPEEIIGTLVGVWGADSSALRGLCVSFDPIVPSQRLVVKCIIHHRSVHCPTWLLLKEAQYDDSATRLCTAFYL